MPGGASVDTGPDAGGADAADEVEPITCVLLEGGVRDAGAGATAAMGAGAIPGAGAMPGAGAATTGAGGCALAAGGAWDAGRGAAGPLEGRGAADVLATGAFAGGGALGRMESSGALRTSYRFRDMGSTARHPSSSSSIEKPLIGADSPRCDRQACRAFCHDSASTKSDSFSLFPSDATSTSQRIRRYAFHAGGGTSPHLWTITYQGDVGTVNAPPPPAPV
jgi:hypothetical protein